MQGCSSPHADNRSLRSQRDPPETFLPSLRERRQEILSAFQWPHYATRTFSSWKGLPGRHLRQRQANTGYPFQYAHCDDVSGSKSERTRGSFGNFPILRKESLPARSASFYDSNPKLCRRRERISEGRFGWKSDSKVRAMGIARRSSAYTGSTLPPDQTKTATSRSPSTLHRHARSGFIMEGRDSV